MSESEGLAGLTEEIQAQARGWNVREPVGQRGAAAIRSGHAAVESIDNLLRQLYALRGELVSELRANDEALHGHLYRKAPVIDG